MSKMLEWLEKQREKELKAEIETKIIQKKKQVSKDSQK